MSDVKIDFPYPGGKAKIREELYPHFPEEGRWYVEPFVGRGNIFFEWFKRSAYERYIINDIQQGQFFKALREVMLHKLPHEDDVNEFTFDNWHNEFMAGNPVASVLEPKITFRGKGYAAGYQTGRYKRGRYARLLAAAQDVVRNPKVQIFQFDYVHLPWDSYGEDDFVYLDPPYYLTDGVGLLDIDHEQLLRLLANAKFRWAISGYYSDLYVSNLGEPILQLERKVEMTDDRGATAIECLWVS